MANSRVVNPYMAVFAAVSVACVIGPSVVVRGEANADNAPYGWCNVNSLATIDPEDAPIIANILVTLANITAMGLGHEESYYPAGFPTGDCCGPDWCPDDKQNWNTSSGVKPSGFCFHAKCNKGTDCAECVAAAGAALLEACKMSIGGQIQLQECRIRYEVYGFNE